MTSATPYQQPTKHIGDIELVYLSDNTLYNTDNTIDPPQGGPSSSRQRHECTIQRSDTGVGQRNDTLETPDIYRGGNPPELNVHTDEETESQSTTSSSSSLNVGRRLGALTAVVEQAISRWARAHSTSSSSSSSSSSPSNSVVGSRRRFGRRRRDARTSMVSLQTTLTEQAIIARRKAREEARFVPRQFVFFTPSDLTESSSKLKARGKMTSVERITTTASLQDVTQLLELALKSSSRSRRALEKNAKPIASPSPSSMSQNKENKGKSRKSNVLALRVGDSSNKSNVMRPLPTLTGVWSRGWWLDVASPTWEDMRALGKLLHLHPLTLEDILHKDPREKLEVFPKLGYYFVVIRALEGERSRSRFKQRAAIENDNASIVPGPADEGVIGAVNVYLVVFREGICSFHFEDISEHTAKIRNKILQLEDTVTMSSDWIAHGIIDSIVDAFFPVLGVIEREVEHLDSSILQPTSDETPTSDTSPQFTNEKTLTNIMEVDESDKERMSENDVGKPHHFTRSSHLRFLILPKGSVFSLTQMHDFLKRRLVPNRPTQTNHNDVVNMLSSTSRTLVRMAAMRRIVTSLGRLLGTKGEVVAQMKKRHPSTLETPADFNEGEFAVHMGDIQDHIVTLQNSLVHYERVLSHSHPAYLSQLRFSQSNARGHTDEAILRLTVVSIIVLCIQFVLGCFSMNVNVPRTTDFTAFFSILAGATMFIFAILLLVRHWKHNAKRKYHTNI